MTETPQPQPAAPPVSPFRAVRLADESREHLAQIVGFVEQAPILPEPLRMAIFRAVDSWNSLLSLSYSVHVPLEMMQTLLGVALYAALLNQPAPEQKENPSV
jgi:hypothetical protein